MIGGTGRRIWIDALCINQADIPERSAQVSMMEDIYSNAQIVVVWLGMEDRYTTPALRAINYLAQIPQEEYPRYERRHPAKMGIPQEDCEAMVAFFRRSWFHRVWAVQEVVLASKVVVLLGQNHVVPWEALVKCSNFLMETEASRVLVFETSQLAGWGDSVSKPTVKPIGIEAGALERYKTGLTSIGMPLWSRLMVGRIYKATDPRDNVYAMLGLLKKSRRVLDDPQLAARLPTPDYSKSVPEVFVGAAKFVLGTTKNLMLLSLLEDKYSRSPELVNLLPSWVPDMTVQAATLPLLPFSYGPDNKPNWDPTVGEPNTIGGGVVIDERILCVRGAYVTTITAADMFVGGGSETFGLCDLAIILELMRPYWMGVVTVSGTTFADALWRTLILDTETKTKQSPADPQIGSAFAQWLVSRLLPAMGGRSESTSRRPSIPSIRDPEQLRSALPEGKPTSSGTILARAVWDQISQDPSAFASRPASAQAPSRGSQPAHRRELDNRRRRRRVGFTGTREQQQLPQLVYDLLVEISSVDASGVFPKQEQIDHLLCVLNEPDTSEEKAGITSRVHSYQEMMRVSCSGRQLILMITATTTAGNGNSGGRDQNRNYYLGLGGLSALEGDQIWILPGTNTPWVLRPVSVQAGNSNGNEQFQLVGEAYVHGIMRGEAVKGVEFRDIELV